MTASRLYSDAYERHYYPLLYFAVKLIHDVPAAEDIVNVVLNKVGLGEIGTDHLKETLYRSVKNGCLDHIKHLRRCPEGKMPELTTGEDPINAMIRAELLEEVYRAIDRLPGQRKEVLLLFYREGLTVEEVGVRLGYNKDTVWSLRSKAIKQLKSLLNINYGMDKN